MKLENIKEEFQTIMEDLTEGIVISKPNSFDSAVDVRFKNK